MCVYGCHFQFFPLVLVVLVSKEIEVKNGMMDGKCSIKFQNVAQSLSHG